MSWRLRQPVITDEDLYPMIRAHEITLNLARTPGLAQLLSDLGANSQLRTEMRSDHQRFLARRNITIPEGAVVEVRELEADGWEIEVRLQEGLYMYINGFNNEKGFYSVHGPQRPPKRADDGGKRSGA